MTGRSPHLVASLAACIASAHAIAHADRGGPDPEGYEWADSFEDDIDDEWLDISDVDTPLFVGLESCSSPIDIGFDFEFYGEIRRQLYVASSGFLVFELMDFIADREKHCGYVSDADPNGAIYGFRQVLDPTDPRSGGVSYATIDDPDRRGMHLFVVTFDSIVQRVSFSELDHDPVTFQIVLYEGSNDIQVNIQESGRLHGARLFDHRPAEIGIENDTGDRGLMICGGPGTIPDDYSVRFRQSVDVGLYPPFDVIIVSPGWTELLDPFFANFSGSAQTATLTARSEQGWTVALSADDVTAAADGVVQLGVNLEVPATASPGTIDHVTVTATLGARELRSVTEIQVSHDRNTEWQQIAPLPMALAHLQAVSDGEYLYAIGGEFGFDAPSRPVDKTFRWDPETNEWDDEAMADLPHPLSRAGACVIDDRVFVAGGVIVTELTEVPEGFMVDDTLNEDLLVYELGSDEWSTVSPPPHAVSEASVVCDADAGLVYVIGGFVDVDGDGHNGSFEGAPIPLMQVYYTHGDEWFEGTPPPYGFYAAGAGLVEGRIVVASGATRDLYQTWYGVEGTLLYDPVMDVWSHGGLIVGNKHDGAAAVYQGHLCLFGGSGNWHDQCYSHPVWIDKHPHSKPWRIAAAAAVLGDQVYVIGGNRPYGFNSPLCSRWPPGELPSPPADGDGDGDGDADTGADADADEDTDGALDGDVDADDHTDAGGDAGAPAEARGGCQCSATGRTSSADTLTFAVLLFLFTWLATSARRRRHSNFRRIMLLLAAFFMIGPFGCDG